MNTIQFSIPQDSTITLADSAKTDITSPGYSEYWLVDQGLAIDPTSDETQEFWNNHLIKIRDLQSNGDSTAVEKLNQELDTAVHCLEFWVEHFMQKYFFAKTCLDIKRGVASEGETERHFAFIKHSKTHQMWYQEIGSLSEGALEEEIDYTADDHHALNAMLAELRALRSPAASLSHQWILSKDFLSNAHLPAFFVELWERLYGAYKTEIQNAIDTDKPQRTQELQAGLQHLVCELSEVREIAEEHWNTAVQIQSVRRSGNGDLESLSDYLDENLFLEYKDMDLEELRTTAEKYELSVAAMNTMLSEAVSLSQTIQ